MISSSLLPKSGQTGLGPCSLWSLVGTYWFDKMMHVRIKSSPSRRRSDCTENGSQNTTFLSLGRPIGYQSGPSLSPIPWTLQCFSPSTPPLPFDVYPISNSNINVNTVAHPLPGHPGTFNVRPMHTPPFLRCSSYIELEHQYQYRYQCTILISISISIPRALRTLR